MGTADGLRQDRGPSGRLNLLKVRLRWRHWRLLDPTHAGPKRSRPGSRVFGGHLRGSMSGRCASGISVALLRLFHRKSVGCGAQAGSRDPALPGSAASFERLPVAAADQEAVVPGGTDTRIREIEDSSRRGSRPFGGRYSRFSLPSGSERELLQRPRPGETMRQIDREGRWYSRRMRNRTPWTRCVHEWFP